MIQTPFKVYYNKRPLRICYLLDIEKTSVEDIKKTISYCYRLWGGRYNPILLMDGKTISPENWEFLKSYDPDIIKSNLKLSIGLVEEIEKYLSPYFIEIPKGDEKEYSPHYSDFPAEISINPENIKIVGNEYFTQPTISLFSIDFKRISGDVPIDFLDLNFSLFDNTLMNEIALGNNPKELYLIKDKKSIIESLGEISKGKKKVFQNQLSSISCSIGEPENYEDKEFGFSVVVGDTVQDLLYFWNRKFCLSSFHKTVIRQIWIPHNVAKDEEFAEVIKKFIKIYSYESWQQNNLIKFISTSIEEDELEEIATNLTKGLYSRNEIKKCDNIKLPKLNNSMYYYKIKENSYKKLYELEDTFEIETPKQISDPSNHMKWAIDLFIEYNSKRFQNYSGKDFWLQLPKRNWLTSWIITLNSRVNSNGFITAIPGGKSPKIKIRIYDDYYTFQDLLVENHKERYPHSDPRNTLKLNFFEDFRISDVGDNLGGILDLFNGLFNAHDFLSERYFRNIFDFMSNRVKVTNENILDIIEKEIHEKFKDLEKSDDFNDKKLDYLIKLILKYSTNNVNSSREVTFEYFEETAKKEFDEYNNLKNLKEGEEFKYERRDLLRIVDSLVSHNILIMGIKPQCPRCGFKNWIQVNEIKSIVNCIGCRYEFNTEAESKWFYKLNKLFEIGYSTKGLLPVILVLGELMKGVKSSFLLIPCVELLDDFDDNLYREKNVKSKHEIDILCLRDGEFIIGEVKQLNKSFHKSDFDKMYDISIRIKPDKIIFSSLDGKPSQLINDRIKKLQAKLDSLNIKVEWFELPSDYFEPSIVR
ncbi:MAG TPA: hypothetical protein VIK14_09050 [Ignavibacteria bacterium]